MYHLTNLFFVLAHLFYVSFKAGRPHLQLPSGTYKLASCATSICIVSMVAKDMSLVTVDISSACLSGIVRIRGVTSSTLYVTPVGALRDRRGPQGAGNLREDSSHSLDELPLLQD